MKKKPRSYSQETIFRLVVWFIVILFTVGLGLIWLIYGRQAAVLGLFCLLGAGLPIGLIGLFLFGLDKITARKD